MKVPISTPQTCITTAGKPITTTTTTTALNTTFHSPNNNNNLCYEPTSVLDLQRSPSSPAGAKAVTPPPPSLETKSNPHHLPTTAVDLDNLEGWDSILSELGLDDSNSNNPKLLLSQISPCESHLTQVLPDFPSSQPFDHSQPSINLPSDYASFCDFSYNQNINPNFGPFDQQLHHHQSANVNPGFGLDFLDDLIRAAQAYESNDTQQVHVILARLNQRLRSPVGKPLQRAAFYFKEALQHLTNNTSPVGSTPPRLTSYEVVQTIRAHKAFSGISPVSLFSTFAANQAILEAVVDGTSPFIHIIDFDIGFGGHWASFMRELVDKAADHETKLRTSMVLRITAVVPEEFNIESKLVKENLAQFARDLNLNFHIDFVMIPTFEILSYKSMKIMEGERVAIHLSPGVFNRFSNNSRSGISKFLGDLRGISPTCVVVVDKEVGIDAGTASFGPTFLAGIEFYTGMMESIEVAATGGFTGGGDCLRRIETFVLRPRIFAAVEAAAKVSVRETLILANALQKEVEMLIKVKEEKGDDVVDGSFDGSKVDEFLRFIEDNRMDLGALELNLVEAANGVISKLRYLLEPFRFVTDDGISWEEKSAVVRLSDKISKLRRNKLWRKRKRCRVAESIAKKDMEFKKLDGEADEWRAKEIAKDMAQQKVEKMKVIAKQKAKEERKKLEAELELALIVEKLQELRAVRIQKLKKQGHFLPEEDDKFLERVRAAVEEEERQAKAAAATGAAKDAIAAAEESRKVTQVVKLDPKDESSRDDGEECLEQETQDRSGLSSLVSTSKESEKLGCDRQSCGAYDYVANLPPEFYHYYHGSNTDMGTLIEVRRTWDAYLRPGGSRVPGHWVQPPPPADEVWASYLVQRK